MGKTRQMIAICTAALVLVISVIPATLAQEADTACSAGRRCVSTVDCEPYTRASDKLRQLDRGSAEYRQLLARLKQQVCNRQLRRVCCRAALPSLSELATLSTDQTNSSSPRWVPASDQCGLSGDSAFVRGGEDTKLGEFPWMALLRRERAGGRVFWHCGGTLINKWYVLTAAHCGPQVDYVRVGEWKVVDTNNFNKQYCTYYDEATRSQCEDFRPCNRRGCVKTNGNTDCTTVRGGTEICAEEHQDVAVSKVITHPEYTTTLKGLAINDIMMLKLENSVVFNQWVAPACLPDLSLTELFGEPGHVSLNYGMAKVVGWGSTETDVDDEISIISTSSQQKLDMPVISIKDCINKFKKRGLDLTKDLSIQEHLCAGGEIGKDSCRGDSGGPLVARDGDLASYMVVGVVSGGTKRCGVGAPGLFTRVSSYRRWIVQNLV